MKSTTDLWLASYIIRSGISLSDFRVLGPRKVSFQFDIEDEAWKSLKMEYFNSDIAEFEKIMEKLKDLSYGG